MPVKKACPKDLNYALHFQSCAKHRVSNFVKAEDLVMNNNTAVVAFSWQASPSLLCHIHDDSNFIQETVIPHFKLLIQQSLEQNQPCTAYAIASILK